MVPQPFGAQALRRLSRKRGGIGCKVSLPVQLLQPSPRPTAGGHADIYTCLLGAIPGLMQVLYQAVPLVSLCIAPSPSLSMQLIKATDIHMFHPSRRIACMRFPGRHFILIC